MTAAVVDQRPGESLVVASVPADHPYVRHLGAEGGGGPVRIAVPGPVAGPVWAPPNDADLVHLHHGLGTVPPGRLHALLDAVEAEHRALVVTVHDLRGMASELDAVVDRADALITLTRGAAEEIRRRWGRTAAVAPHPHVADFRTMQVAADARARRRTGQFRIGLRAGRVRPSTDPRALLPVLAEVVGELPHAVLQLDVRRERLDTEDCWRAVSRLRHVDLRLHDHRADDVDDRAFFSHLSSLDVSVLPYRSGTHSGWLEACRDLGTTVIAPTCGYYAEQGPVLGYAMDEQHLDAASLRDAVCAAYDERPPFGATVPERRRQRELVARVHDEVYRSVTGGR